MSIRDIILSLFVLAGIPVVTGRTFCLAAHKGNSFVYYYVYGTFFIFALIQFIGVPLVVLGSSFNGLLILVFLFIFCFDLYGFIREYLKNYQQRRKKKRKKNRKKKKGKKKIRIGNIIGITMIAIVTILTALLGSRYQYDGIAAADVIVKAGDMLNSNVMFMIDPSTGEEMTWFNYTRSYKDVGSPWAVYIACLARVCIVKVSVMARSIMPVNLLLLCVCTWWIFIGKLLGRNIRYRTIFIILMLILIMYLIPNENSLSYLMYAAPWTGDAFLVLAGIVFMFIVMFDYYDRSNTRNLICILICSLAMCLMSYSGIFISLTMIAGFSLIYGVLKKDLMLSVKLLGLTVPPLLYMLIGIVVRNTVVL